MGEGDQFWSQLDETANRLAAEAILATVGSDSGLIPAYSLLGDLHELAAALPDLRFRLEAVRAALERRLDAALPFDAESLELLRDVGAWLPRAVAAARAGEVVRPAVPTTAAAGPAAADPSGMPDLNDPGARELYGEFHAETAEHLQRIEAGMLALEQRPDDGEALNAVFRSFHTIKGNSGFLGLTAMNRTAHEIETLLDRVRTGEIQLEPELVSEILRSRDQIEGLNREVGAALGGRAAPASPAPAVSSSPTATAGAAGTAPAAAPAPPPAAAEAATVRVSIVKLDSLMDVVGELVIVQSQLSETARRFAESAPPLPGNVAQLHRLTKELQATAMSLRMIPIRPTFQKMERLARDLIRNCGKSAVFSSTGGETELDRTMVEELADPLVHMVRNAIDHGLETAAERVAAGKSAQGSISLSAYHQGGQVIVELRDDGRGLNAARILARARERGLVPPGADPSPAEIYRYIFLPGFSTAQNVTALSGRGVGMDVVQRNVERLRGKIEIASTLGAGATFRLKLPLTTAIIDGLIVRVGSDRFILPAASVQRALRPERAALATIQECGEVLQLNGRVIPVQRLHRHFSISARAMEPADGILVIVEAAGCTRAILVDEMVSKQEVVIKNLGSFLQGLTGATGVAGGAILGDGNIALILDPAALFQAA